MLVRLWFKLSLLTLLGLAALPAPAVRAQQPAGSPALILRIRSIDSLRTDAQYLIKLVGEQEKAKQLDALLDLYVKDKGVDAKKPIGVYGTVGQFGFDSTAVVMVPINDDKAFTKLLEGLGYTVNNDKGLYTIGALLGQQDGYLRFANGYGYLSNSKGDVSEAKKLIAPSVIFDPSDKAAVSAVLRLGQVPKSVRDQFIEGLVKGIDEAKNKKLTDETEAQTRLKLALTNSMAEQVKQVLNEGNELALRFDVDSKGGEVSLELGLAGQPQSKLATSIAGIAANKSLFGSALGSDSGIHVLMHGSVPESIRKLMAPVIDEGIAKAIADEKKPENKVIAEQFLKALGPTLKSGEMDAAVTLRGPNRNDKYTLLIGVKVADGLGIDQTLRDVVKGLKVEEQAKIKFDAEKIGSVNVHTFAVGKDVDEKARKLFGEGPLYLAIRKDAGFFAFGEGAMDVLKEAVTASPAPAPMVQFEISLSRLMTLIAVEEPNAAKAAQAVFAQGQNNDKVRVSIEGGKMLKARFSMKGDVLRFLSQVNKDKAGN